MKTGLRRKGWSVSERGGKGGNTAHRRQKGNVVNHPEGRGDGEERGSERPIGTVILGAGGGGGVDRMGGGGFHRRRVGAT